MPDVCEWDNFFKSYRGGLDGENQGLVKWRVFLEKFKELYVLQKISESDLPIRHEITAEELQSFFSKLKPFIHDHYKYGYGVNVWDVAGVNEDEMRNSSILSWLLDCNGSHGQGNVFLEGLLCWLATSKGVPEKARNNLPIPGSTQNVRYWTRVESLPLGEKESRVDIEIGGPFVLIIEVKVNSQENGDQLKRYIEIARNKAVTNKWGVLFLTRKGSEPNDKSLLDHLCRISWKQVANIINVVVNNNEELKGSFFEHYVKQFCQHIKSL